MLIHGVDLNFQVLIDVSWIYFCISVQSTKIYLYIEIYRYSYIYIYLKILHNIYIQLKASARWVKSIYTLDFSPHQALFRLFFWGGDEGPDFSSRPLMKGLTENGGIQISAKHCALVSSLAF